MKMRKKRPLRRSIACGCFLFIAVLCLALSVLNYFDQRASLYARYQFYITDLLRYMDRRIDDADMIRCIETGEESQTYRQTLRFADEIMNTHKIHYLYIEKPLNLNETENVMCVLSAEDDYNRYLDSEGNLYLGWIADDEYSTESVKRLFEIMEQDEIVFYENKTTWGYDYTGSLPLKDAAGKSYAVLSVDVDITEIYSELLTHLLKNFVLIVCMGLLLTVSFLGWTRHNVTEPIQQLEKSVVDYAARSHGQRNVEAFKFEAPEIRSNNEVRALSEAITQMTEDMQGYVSEFLSAVEKAKSMRELADQMSELAVADTLTGIRNKNAFALEIGKLERELQDDRGLHFALGMVDMNYLKRINDTYGHEKGDDALRCTSRLLCKVFSHSQVFRVGGDEFAVILRAYDYQHAESLQNQFMSQITPDPFAKEEPWNHVSASIGIAFYDPSTDSTVDEVLKRADQIMYEQKKKMKAIRTDTVSPNRPDQEEAASSTDEPAGDS